MPHVVGYPPKSVHDIKVIVNYSRLFKMNAELCQDESFAISCKTNFAVPWNCLEAAVNMLTNTLMWVNPDFYSYYFVAPAGETQVEVKVEPQEEAKEETPSLIQRVNQLLLEKCVNKNCAICTRCMAREQIGTMWCYSCGEPMVMQKDLPMSHSQIAALTQEKSRSPPAERTSTSTGSAVKTEQGETQRASDDWCPHGDSTITFGNLTWTQRMREWRKSAFKKKDKITHEYQYRWTNWPICERFLAEPDYAQSCSIMSRQYFNCDFDWDMAVEADRLAFRQEQLERKGKGSGKPGQQTFDV